MKRYKKYALGLFVCFVAYGLVSSSASAFWGFGKSKKENNANYAGAVAKTRGSSSSVGVTSITVISPNGGEALNAGKKYEIKWKSKGFSKKEKAR